MTPVALVRRVFAGAALQMLAGTPAGDAYTFAELDAMLRAAGFKDNELRDVPGSVQRVVLSRR